MNGKALLVMLAFLVWGVICWNWYVCSIKGQCGDGEKVSEVDKGTQPLEEKIEIPKPPLYFNTSLDSAGKGPGFGPLKSAIVSRVNGGEDLRIVGQYFRDEVNKTSFENLGLARANKVKALIEEVDPNKIETEGRAIPRSIGTAKDFEAVTFTFIPPSPKPVGDLIKEPDGTDLSFSP